MRTRLLEMTIVLKKDEDMKLFSRVMIKVLLDGEWQRSLRMEIRIKVLAAHHLWFICFHRGSDLVGVQSF